MRFTDAANGPLNKMRHEFTAANQPVFLPVEEHNHHGADFVSLDQARAFETHRNGTRIVVGSRRTGHGIIVRPQQHEGAVGRPRRSGDDIVVVALQGWRIAIPRHALQQQISCTLVCTMLSKEVAREGQRLYDRAKVFGRNFVDDVLDDRVAFGRHAVPGTTNLHECFRSRSNRGSFALSLYCGDRSSAGAIRWMHSAERGSRWTAYPSVMPSVNVFLDHSTRSGSASRSASFPIRRGPIPTIPKWHCRSWKS